jgi:glycine/D-amino acid oxidase-like deaminating enzyme
LTFACAAAGIPINRTLHSSKCYIVPRNDGRILIGATVEYVGFHKANTAGGINSLLAAAFEVAPIEKVKFVALSEHMTLKICPDDARFCSFFAIDNPNPAI